MLSHDHEIKLVRFGGVDELGEVSRAVATQRRMHVNDALVVGKLTLDWWWDSLCSELLDRLAKTPEAVTTIGKRKLAHDDESEDGDKDSSLHK
jgi:hypothetical protein